MPRGIASQPAWRPGTVRRRTLMPEPLGEDAGGECESATGAQEQMRAAEDPGEIPPGPVSPQDVLGRHSCYDPTREDGRNLYLCDDYLDGFSIVPCPSPRPVGVSRVWFARRHTRPVRVARSILRFGRPCLWGPVQQYLRSDLRTDSQTYSDPVHVPITCYARSGSPTLASATAKAEAGRHERAASWVDRRMGSSGFRRVPTERPTPSRY